MFVRPRCGSQIQLSAIGQGEVAWSLIKVSFGRSRWISKSQFAGASVSRVVQSELDPEEMTRLTGYSAS